MKRFARLPSPAMLVALAALFVALGGSAYAAIRITGANVVNNSLVGADIKNKALAGRDIKNDSLGRVPIKEERLDASKFGTVNNSLAVGGATAKKIEPFDLSVGQSKPFLTAGPFTLTANCRASGGNEIAEIVISTSSNDAAVDGAQKDANFDVGDSAQFVASSAAAGTPSFDQESAGAAIATDGTEILGQEVYVGTSVLGKPNTCRYGGVVWVG
jgi:hypothetical protein